MGVGAGVGLEVSVATRVDEEIVLDVGVSGGTGARVPVNTAVNVGAGLGTRVSVGVWVPSAAQATAIRDNTAKMVAKPRGSLWKAE